MPTAGDGVSVAMRPEPTPMSTPTTTQAAAAAAAAAARNSVRERRSAVAGARLDACEMRTGAMARATRAALTTLGWGVLALGWGVLSYEGTDVICSWGSSGRGNPDAASCTSASRTSLS